MTSTSRVPLVYGTGSFGEAGKHVTRLHTIGACQEVVDAFVKHGYNVFDCARVYGLGTSEEFVGKLDLRGGRVDTKLFAAEPGGFAPDKLRAQMAESLNALGPHKIRVLYLHAPDRVTPIEDTLRELNEMYKEGLFEEIGLSNYHSWEVAEFVWIARKNGWKQPTVYQGVYNALERMVETELIPCLRKYDIRFYAYSPLAGGLLLGNILSSTDVQHADSKRWNPTLGGRLAEMQHDKYAGLIPHLRPVKEALDKHGIIIPEAAHRWLQHHSALTPQDGVVIGSSSVAQLETNIGYCQKGPLPQDVVAILDEAWKNAKSTANHYARTGGERVNLNLKPT
ncbi:Aldo/keto reductase [Calocera viscosa TUFC12733]|uniref:Aldo/keto reductase n=1 Tax=Calocera viscosa (strain TUFC12733) TaxID=1330018 RepID=A0A167RRI8_CALVF|nr:Aldo/keto reductase [Calocera viscosa TUFC12733]